LTRVPPIRGVLATGLGFALGLPSTASAAVTTSGCAAVGVSCTLAELVNGGSITVNQQRFESFALELDVGGRNLSQIVVRGLDSNLQEAGIAIDGGGQWYADPSDSLLFRLGYRVRSVVAGTGLGGARLDLVSPTTIGGGFLRGSQTVFDAAGRELGDATGDADSDFETSLFSDSFEWPARSQLYSETEIFLDSSRLSGVAELAIVDVHFTLPEPGIGIGVAACAALAAAVSRTPRSSRP
jgi:hypothetical protein